MALFIYFFTSITLKTLRASPSRWFLFPAKFLNRNNLKSSSLLLSSLSPIYVCPAMSASTVSLTANPAARRRPVVASERKNNFDMVPGEGAAPLANGVLTGGDDKVTAVNTKDLSNHSIRADVVLERSSRDLLQVKKTVANPTVSPRRTRKVSTKYEKPRWMTIFSVFVKNLVLLIVLLGLVQLIWRLALKSGNGSLGTQFGLSEFEGRIAEVESFLKTTTKMIQVQVDVVDRKIESEIGGLRKEVNKKIEDREAAWGSDLKLLETKSEALERSLGQLSTADWLSKQEFDKIYEDLIKGKNGEFTDGTASLDDVRAYAKEMVEKEIEKHAADGLGMVDYASASCGAMVVKHSEAYPGGSVSWFRKRKIHQDADKMLRPSFGEPGQCFPLKGSTGFVQIKLKTPIIPEAITLEHVAKSVAYDRSSAPKDCRVSGWLHGHGGVSSRVNTEKMLLVGEFTYDLEKSNAQTFGVDETAKSGVVDTVRFDFLSNHGSPSHTCIYRLRVHGREPESVLTTAM